MSNRSILKKITKNNDPIIGISGNLVLGPTEIDKSNLSGLTTNREIKEGEELFQNYHHFKYWESLIDE